VNHSTISPNQSFHWTPFLDKILKNLGIPYASSLINIGRLIQQNKTQKNVGLLQKKPINRMTWQQFELFLQWFFEQQGYKVRKTKKSGDQGADLVLEKLGIKTVIQIKKRKKTTGNDAVQQVHAARGYYQADRAIVITSSKFSAPAKELAN
jgi:HJR/Mrr/RecB family endonuclease